MRDALGRALRVTAVTAFCVLAVFGRGGCTVVPPEEEQARPTIEIEPVLFIGRVEVTGDDERGFGVLLSTATEEVVVADSAIGRRLADYEGEVVAAYGRLLESADAPPTIVVREFHVLGSETHEPGVSRAGVAGG
jgi:hypothetical protein